LLSISSVGIIGKTSDIGSIGVFSIVGIISTIFSFGITSIISSFEIISFSFGIIDQVDSSTSIIFCASHIQS